MTVSNNTGKSAVASSEAPYTFTLYMSPLKVLKFLKSTSTKESKWKLLVAGTSQSTNDAVKFALFNVLVPISL